MNTTGFILTGAVHFAACLLVFGVCVFQRFVVTTAAERSWRPIGKVLLLTALPVVFLSGLFWVLLFTASVAGLVPNRTFWQVLVLVWTKSRFGPVWQWRLSFWLLLLVASVLELVRPRATRSKLVLVLAGLLVVSLAWSGHGRTGKWVELHLFADGVHLLTAAIWPVGLLPFSLLLVRLRRDSAPDWPVIVTTVRRFSAIGLGSVAVLFATGAFSSVVLVRSWGNLFGSPYGRLLLVKIVLFAVMVGIGAMNLLRLKPPICFDQSEMAAKRLQWNVGVELILTTIVIAVVAVLGTLAPPYGAS